MAVLMMLELPGATLEQYERTNEILEIAGDEDAPDGLISHVAGPTDDGILIVDVWDSPESLERFFEERGVGRAMQEAGAPEGEPRVLPVHNHFEGSGTNAGVLVIAEIDGFGPDVYDEMISSMDEHAAPGNHPSVQHTAAVTESGGVIVVDLWESPEAFGEFAQKAVAPAGEAVGLAPFEPRFVPVHNRLRGASG
jgi:hypothetical protein